MLLVRPSHVPRRVSSTPDQVTRSAARITPENSLSDPRLIVTRPARAAIRKVGPVEMHPLGRHLDLGFSCGASSGRLRGP
jgi:hypothetical protein